MLTCDFRSLVFVSLTAIGLGMCINPTNGCADEKPFAKSDPAWVEKRIRDWQPTKEERLFDEIGWAKDIREAQRLAKEHGRPVFLFTYDGVSLANYRC